MMPKELLFVHSDDIYQVLGFEYTPEGYCLFLICNLDNGECYNYSLEHLMRKKYRIITNNMLKKNSELYIKYLSIIQGSEILNNDIELTIDKFVKSLNNNSNIGFVKEGKEQKGGQNMKPTTPRLSPPSGKKKAKIKMNKKENV
jgi:hypothetical protein